MTPPLIRRAPGAEPVARSAGRPGIAINVAMNDCAAVARGATAPIIPLLKSREARANLVGIVCSEMTLVGNAASVWKLLLGANSRSI